MAAPSRKLNFDLLRPGVSLASRYKLVDRIPRWVAQRRMRAQPVSGGNHLQILFLDVSEEEIDFCSALVARIANIRHPNLLPLLSAEILNGFPAILADFVNGPTLRERLDNEGALPPEEARKMFASLWDAVSVLSEQGLPIPAILPETVLLSPAESGWTPLLFPLVLPGVSAPDPSNVPAAFRDFLFSISTNQTPPLSYENSVIHRLPASVREIWLPLFTPSPTLDDLLAVASTPVESLPQQAVTPDAPLPSSSEKTTDLPQKSRPPQPGRTPRSRPSSSDTSRPSRPSRQISDASLPPPDAHRLLPAVSAIAALGTAAFAGWFSWSILTALSPKPLPSSIPLAQSAPNISNATPSQLRALDEVPTDAKGKPGTAMEDWVDYRKKHPDNPAVDAAFASYLASMEPHTATMRRGQMPTTLAALERAAQDGFPPARFLLAQVLWGKETQRSERLMIDLSRIEYAPAREWCEVRYIDWKP